MEDYKARFEKKLTHEINKSELSIIKRIESNGRISVVLADDKKYYIYHEIDKIFEYPSYTEGVALDMYYDLVR